MPKRDFMEKQRRAIKALERQNTAKIDDDIYLIIGKNKGTFPYSNSLLIVDEKIVLIDSGAGDEIMQMLVPFVDILINSHYHIDHILGNRLFSELWVVEEEAGVTGSFENYKKFAGIHEVSIEDEWLYWFNEYFTFYPSSFTKTFKAGQAFDFGKTRWQTVHTPGHSPGHCCFYESERNIMFSSDIDLTSFGPWYGNPNANLNDFIESIQNISEFEIDVIATSHTVPRNENIKQALKDYLNIIYERDERILALLEKEPILEDISAEDLIYKKEHKRYKAFEWFEKKMIEKHLERLIELGKVALNKERYTAL
jgi:glyoxylase-like metal-dependent hydrolase (beta-lactamase superfamily II)